MAGKPLGPFLRWRTLRVQCSATLCRNGDRVTLPDLSRPDDPETSPALPKIGYRGLGQFLVAERKSM